MDDGEPTRAERAEHGDARVPAEERRSGRGAAVALGGLIVVAGLMLGVIAMDAGWLGGVEDASPVPVQVVQSATPACGEAGSCADSAGPGATPGTTSRARPSARPVSRTGNGGTYGGSGGGRQSQADLARKARDAYAPRPPSAPGIDQDELDRQRDEAERTVAPVPGDNGPTPAP